MSRCLGTDTAFTTAGAEGGEICATALCDRTSAASCIRDTSEVTVPAGPASTRVAVLQLPDKLGHGQQSEVFCAANEALRAVPGIWPLQAVQGGEICADACHVLATTAEASTCFTNFPTFALRQGCMALPHASQKSAAWLVCIKVRNAQPLPCVDFVGSLTQFGHETRVLVEARFFRYLQASINTSKQFSWQFPFENQQLAHDKVRVFVLKARVFVRKVRFSVQ